MKKIFRLLCLLLLSSFNYNLIIKRYSLTIGGTQGLSIIICNFFNWTPSIIILIINMIMFVLSLLLLSKETSQSIAITTFIYPLFIRLTSFINIQIINHKSIMVIISGIISGYTISNILKLNYSSGGINVLVILLKKYYNINEYLSNFILNGVILVLGLFMFGINTFINSLIALIINSLVIKLSLKNVNHCQINHINNS